MRTRMRRTIAALTLGTAMVAGACSNESSDPNAAPTADPDLRLAAALEPFDGCDALLGAVKEEALRRVTAYGLPTDGDMGPMRFESVGTAIDDAGASPPTTVTASAPGAEDAERSMSSESDASAGLPTTGGGEDGQTFSGTNVQEVGVDEPDIVKTDGRRLFSLQGNTLYAFTVDGDSPNQVGVLDLELGGGSAASLLLAGDDLLVLGDVYGGGVYSSDGRSSSYGYDTGGATLTKIDVSDPTDMQAGATTVVDGQVLNARMVGTTARVVLESPPPVFDFVTPSRPGSPRAEQTALDANRKLIEESQLEDWLPSYVVDADDAKRTDAQPLLDCAKVSRPKQFSGFGTVTVFTVPLDGDIDPANAVGVLAAGDQVYASSEHLYVSTTRWPDEPVDEDGVPVPEEDTEPTTSPSTTEPDQPGTTVDEGDDEDEGGGTTTTVADPIEEDEVRTAIHRFAIPADGPAVYEASGEVLGQLLHDFALSEHDGDLRVASTYDDIDPRSGVDRSESYVTVLREQDGALAQIGQVGGLGKGEQIRAVRFIDDVGYVVTFRQTDPLYTIDLSDPTSPEVVGELKVLGYSAYLHPVGDGRLLGIGQDATERGRTIGTQVALYDVSDPAEPKELQKVTLPYGDSLVESDYHAFLWWDPTSLAMVPAQSYGGGCIVPDDVRGLPCESYDPGFVGAIGYTITPDAITELAKVAQPAEGTPGVVCPLDAECVFEEPIPTAAPTTTVWSECPPDADCVAPTIEPVPYPALYPSPIQRSVVVGDLVLTISPSGIRASDLDTLRPIAWAPFDPDA